MENYTNKLEFKIRMYKELCKIAKIPQLLIDHPELIQANPLKNEEIELANKWIEDYRKSKMDDLPF